MVFSLIILRNRGLEPLSKRSRLFVWWGCGRRIQPEKQHRIDLQGSSTGDGGVQSDVQRTISDSVVCSKLLLQVLVSLYVRCGNVASILELDENLSK